MLKQENPVGNYTSRKVKSLTDHDVTATLRKQMVMLIKELHQSLKFRKLESLYQAVYSADKYLISTLNSDTSAPCLVKLAVTTLIIAAKLCEEVILCLNDISHVLKTAFSIKITKQEMVNNESEVLRKLDFDLQTVTSL